MKEVSLLFYCQLSESLLPAGRQGLNITPSLFESVKSFNPCQSVIQTIYDIAKAHGGVPIAIEMKVDQRRGRK